MAAERPASEHEGMPNGDRKNRELAQSSTARTFDSS
jgi:hypothetical protein